MTDQVAPAQPDQKSGPLQLGEIAADAPVTQREIRIVYVGFMVVMALAALDQSVVTTALPRIVSDLGGVAYLSWVVTAYVLASTSVMPLYGKLSDQYGRKPLIYSAVLIFLFGSLLAAMSTTMTQLIIFRVIQGLGAGGLMPLSQIVIGDLVSPRERGRYQGAIGMVYIVATLGGPALGGIITDALSWHWIFLINLPIGVAALFMIAVTLRRRHKVTIRSIDYSGAALLALATCGFLLTLGIGGRTFPWLSVELLGLAASTLAVAILFVWRELRAPEPILPMSLFRNPVFTIAILVTALTFMSSQGASVYFPLFFQVVYGVNMSNSGWLTAPLMIGVVTAARINGHMVVRTGRYKNMQIAGLILSIIGFCGLTFCAASGQAIWLIEICIVAIGFSMGLVNPNMVVAVQNSVDPRHLGAATAATSYFRSLGGVTGVTACGAILTAQLASQFQATQLPDCINGPELMNGGIVQVLALPPAAHEVVVEIYRHAIASSFGLGIVMTSIALLIGLRLPELALKTKPGGGAEKSP